MAQQPTHADLGISDPRHCRACGERYDSSAKANACAEIDEWIANGQRDELTGGNAPRYDHQLMRYVGDTSRGWEIFDPRDGVPVLVVRWEWLARIFARGRFDYAPVGEWNS